VDQEPISEPAANGHGDFDAIWWPTPNGNGAGHGHAPPLAPGLVDRAQPGADQAADEIWGTRSVLRTTFPRSVEEPVSEEIWGAARRSVASDIAAPESIWEDRPKGAAPPAPRAAAHRPPFLLPDAWAAAPRRTGWRRRLDAFGGVSRRTD